MGLYRPKETRHEVDYSRLLFRNRAAAVYDQPFFHGCIDNYLPDHIYQDLLETFPKETLRINYSAKATLDSDSARLKSFWLESPFCKDLLNFFASETFLQDTKAFLAPTLVRERGYYEQRGWYYVSEWSKASRLNDATPVKITFKFSRLTRDGWVPPHTDNPCKLLSILLYFGEDHWSESYGGGTEIYEPKITLLKNNWRGFEAPFEWMNCSRTFAFVPNRLVFVLKSKNSWHGVSPLACPEGSSRKSLLITLHDRAYEKETTLHKTARGAVRTWMRLKGYR